MEYGKVLRFHRVKQGLTQNQLAEGIISSAYLSKIENDQTVPAVEVLELLYERLGLDFSDSSYSHPSKEKLKEWYEAIVFKRREDAELLMNELLQQKETLANHHLYIFFELYRIRYLLLENEVEKAYEAWENIRQHKDTFDDEMNFYFHLVSGLMKYYKSKFEDSYQDLMEAKNYSSSLELEDWQYSDLYYLLALSTGQANYISASIFYTSLALEIYQSHYDLTKSADCHIIQGINFSRLRNYSKSLENFDLARKIATQTNNRVQLKLVYINIGVLESRLENHMASISSYKKSLEFVDEINTALDTFEFLNIIHGLITQHYKLNDENGCIEWINEGERQLISYPSKPHELHFKVYKYIMTENEDIQELLENEVIPYFQESRDHTYAIRYAMFLADLLEKQRMYKKSSSYLRLAIQLLNKHSHLGGGISL